MTWFIDLLLWFVDHLEVLIALIIFDIAGLVLLEWESKRYFQEHPEELEEDEILES